MAEKPSNSSKKGNFQSKLNTTWTTIIAGCTLMSMGFGTGYYIVSIRASTSFIRAI